MPLDIIEQHFPGATTLTESHTRVEKWIEEQGNLNRTLFAISDCPDEINRDLARTWGGRNGWDRSFNMGGLAGLPFAGKTGLGACIAHVPTNGTLFIVTTSHIGLTKSGKFGYVVRNGMMGQETTACGAAIGAFSYLKKNPQKIEGIKNRDPTVYPAFNDPFDAQQNYVIQFIASKFPEIMERANGDATKEMVILSQVLAEKVYEDLVNTIPKNLKCDIVILSGVQINREGGDEDYFYPIKFTVFKKPCEVSLSIITGS